MQRHGVGGYLKRARIAAGYHSQAALVAALKKKKTPISQQQISNYEKTGKVPPDKWRTLAGALNVPFQELAMVLAEASDETERASRRETSALLERSEELMAKVGLFVERYEELSHTYRSLEEEVRSMRADAALAAERLERRLERIEQHLGLTDV